jgi:hypothetical protein
MNAPPRPISWKWNSAWKCGPRRSSPARPPNPPMAYTTQATASTPSSSTISADRRSSAKAMPHGVGQLLMR